MLTQLADPQRAPEVLTLRDRIRSWRFYDHFRTDADAPAVRRNKVSRTGHAGHAALALVDTLTVRPTVR
jgi:predicted ATPase